MFISKKKFQELEKRIADLENKSQGQPKQTSVILELDSKAIANSLATNCGKALKV